jgi:hypothetical protein
MRHLILLAIFASLSGMAHVNRPIHVIIYFDHHSPSLILNAALSERVNIEFMDVGELEKAADLIIDVTPESQEDIEELIKKKRPILLFDVPTDDDDLLSYLGVSKPKEVRKVTTVSPDQEHPITQGMKPWQLASPAMGVDPLSKSRELDKGTVFWTREIDGVRIVATTLGTDFPTILDEKVHDILGQAVLWLTDNLADHGGPKPGYGGDGEVATLSVMREILALAPKSVTETPIAESAKADEPNDEPADVTLDWTITPEEPGVGRYLTFEATSAQGGGHFGSLAELVVLGADGEALPREDWRITSSSSEQAPRQLAKNILDGDDSTIWHSRYINGVAEFPHTLRIDMRSSQTVTGLICTPREGSKVGLIKGYRVYASEGAGRGTILAKGDFAN